MQLHDIVEINQQGLVADAVNLKMMADDSKNLPLCNGFVFNYDASQPKASTLGVLDAIRESFHSANSSNIHLMVQDFGKGKSHFALTVANFFKKPADSPEVAGILHQIDFATSGRSNAVYEKLRAYKQRSRPHLVVCISGEVAADLNKMLLRALRDAMDEHSIRGAMSQQLIEKPLSYLKQLSDEKRAKAENYLEENDHSFDLEGLTELLSEDNYGIIPTVVELSEHLEGFAINFEYNLNIESLLEDVIQKLCTGENRQFEGVIILFDEINAYLRTWLGNEIAAGGSALQNITNVCARHGGKVALFCLAQVKPSVDTQVPFLKRKNYERFTSRIELTPSTYEPRASLEQVIDNLLKQSEGSAEWTAFLDQWGNTLQRESRSAYEKYITAYSTRELPFEKFYEHLGLGCYPLHPLTAYLLCNLDFTQGRTAIQFIKEDATKFISSKPVEIDGKLQFIYPVQLLDAFSSSFSQISMYPDYEKAHNAIASIATDDEVIALKAIALYYLSGNKLTKPDRESQDGIISVITGFSLATTKEILKKLADEYQVIYYNPSVGVYRFYSGFSIADLRRKIEEDTESKTLKFGTLLKHCQKNLTSYLSTDTVRGSKFIESHKLNSEDWHFRKAIFSVDELQRVLSGEQAVRKISEKGLIAYFIGEYDEDLDDVERRIESVLAKAPKIVQERVIVAIPKRGTRDLSRTLLMMNALNEKSTKEKQEFGDALSELSKQLEEQLDSELQDMFDSCTHTCRVIDRIPRAEVKRLESIVSRMLEELYPFVAPIEGQDKLRTRSAAGSKVVSFASRQLLAGDLKEPFPDKSYKNLIQPIFVRCWGLLKPGTPYSVNVPNDASVRQAWDTLSEMTDIGDKPQSSTEVGDIWNVLSEAPFGYSELTFTILFASWLAYHRSEVDLSGGFGIPRRKSDTVSVKTARIHEWANPDVNVFEKAKDFVQVWVQQGKNKVIRRKPLALDIPDSINYTDAVAWIEKISEYLQSGVLDSAKVASLEKKQKQIQQGIETIEDWFVPTAEAKQKLEAQEPLAQLVQYYTPLEAKHSVVIRDDFVIVRPTEDQIDTWRATRQTLRDRVESFVEELSAQSQSFETPEQGQRLISDIERTIQVLAQISELPTRFEDSLTIAKETASQRTLQLQKLEQKQTLLVRMQTLIRGLGENATQGQYSFALERIQSLSEQAPEVQQDPAYLEIVSDLESKQDQLIRKIDTWESQFASIGSHEDAFQLNQAVSRERNRFDDDVSKQQIDDLINRLKDRVLQQEGAIALEEEFSAVVQNARQKVGTINSLNSFDDIVRAYDELAEMSLPTKPGASNAAKCQQELESHKLEAKQSIEQKLAQLYQHCDEEIKRSEEYEQRKGLISRARRLVADHSEFSSATTQIETARNNLESKYLNLQKQDSDREVMRDIQQFKPLMGNTILRCEEIIESINELKSQLNFPEQFSDAIQRSISAFEGKRAEHCLKLDELAEQLRSIESLTKLQQLRNELAKLELIFESSKEYPRYKEQEDRIQAVEEDLRKVSNLEEQSANVLTISSINRVLTEVSNTKPQIRDLDRFGTRLISIEELLTQRRQQFIAELTKWQQDLDYIADAKAARRTQKKISDSVDQYGGSEYEEAYELARNSIGQLTYLLEQTDKQKIGTMEDCQAEIDRLHSWKSDQESVAQVIDNRILAMERILVQTKKTIYTRQHNAAQKWITGLQEDASQIESATDGAQRLELAVTILKGIKQKRNKYEPFLEDNQKSILSTVSQKCYVVQSQDLSSKIETLFKELPRYERVELYKKLGTHLENTTEVF